MASRAAKTIGLTLALVSLALAVASGILALQANYSHTLHEGGFWLLLDNAKSLELEAGQHRLRGAIHTMAIIEEATRSAPPRDISSQRLALSIALTQNGTGFEDLIISRVQHNATDEELNQYRFALLNALFQNLPSAKDRQEVLLMHTDVLLTQLKAAARVSLQAESFHQRANQERFLADKAALQSLLAWKALLVLILASIAGAATMAYHRAWMLYLCAGILIYGCALLIQAFFL